MDVLVTLTLFIFFAILYFAISKVIKINRDAKLQNEKIFKKLPITHRKKRGSPRRIK